jgi:hypothetical protein
VTAIQTLEHSLVVDHFTDSSFNSERLAVEKRVGHTSARALHNAPEGRPRNSHALGRLLLREALEVRETQGLQLVKAQGDDLHRVEGNALGLEVRGQRATGDSAADLGARHFAAPSK